MADILPANPDVPEPEPDDVHNPNPSEAEDARAAFVLEINAEMSPVELPVIWNDLYGLVVPTPTLTALAFVAACAETLNAWTRTVRPYPPRTRMPTRFVGYASVNVEV